MRFISFVVGAGFVGATALIGASHVANALAQDTAATDTPISVRWDGNPGPTGVNGPDGRPFDPGLALYSGVLRRPDRSVRVDDLEVDYDGHEYPLSVRLEPQTQGVQVRVSIDHPKSCADVYLRPLEVPTTTATASVRAAFTLDYMIDGRAGENSCDPWQFRAAKARFFRYQNAMERSEVLAIPESVKASLRGVAGTDSEHVQAEQIIAAAEAEEKQKVAIVLQNRVLAELKAGDVASAHNASALLLETSKQPAFASAVASQIDAKALEKQTSDLAERVANINPDHGTNAPQ